MAKSGRPDFAWGRAGEGGRAAWHRGATSRDPHPQPLPTRGRGAIRGTLAHYLSAYGILALMGLDPGPFHARRLERSRLRAGTRTAGARVSLPPPPADADRAPGS